MTLAGVYSFGVANSGCFPYYYLGLDLIIFSQGAVCVPFSPLSISYTAVWMLR